MKKMCSYDNIWGVKGLKNDMKNSMVLARHRKVQTKIKLAVYEIGWWKLLTVKRAVFG